MCNFQDLLQEYANRLPSTHLMFRVTKKCGYSQLVMIPRTSYVTVADLLDIIIADMGDYTENLVIYYPKYRDVDTFFKYLHEEDHHQPLAEFAVDNFETAYTIDECRYAVYQLYLDIKCEDSNCCSSFSSVVTQSNHEPTRDELLSLIYNPVAEEEQEEMEMEMETELVANSTETITTTSYVSTTTNTSPITTTPSPSQSPSPIHLDYII